MLRLVSALYFLHTPAGRPWLSHRLHHLVLAALTVSVLSGKSCLSLQHFWDHQSRLLVSRSSTPVFNLTLSPAVFWSAW